VNGTVVRSPELAKRHRRAFRVRRRSHMFGPAAVKSLLCDSLVDRGGTGKLRMGVRAQGDLHPAEQRPESDGRSSAPSEAGDCRPRLEDEQV